MKKINLNSVAFLVLGVFLLVTPALSQAIITSLVTAFYRNIDLLLWVNLAQNFWILNLIPKVVGATLVAGFAWKHLKTRFKVDLPKIKVQTTRLATYSLLFMLCAGLFLFADVPVSEAATTATTGYILDTPVAEHAWLIGAYSDGTYYAIEGSTWDNKVAGVGSTAWASYKTNSTKITDLVLDSTTSGSIYMKDVAFDMDLFDDIPEDVRVICSYNAEYWEYINSADSSGSPYTVSVGSGVNVGYYLAQDGEGRICYSSTDCSEVVQSASVGGVVLLSTGNFPISNISPANFTTYRGASMKTMAEGSTEITTLSLNDDADMFVFTAASPYTGYARNIVFENLKFSGGGKTQCAINATNTHLVTVRDCTFYNFAGNALKASGCWEWTVDNNYFVTCGTKTDASDTANIYLLNGEDALGQCNGWHITKNTFSPVAQAIYSSGAGSSTIKYNSVIHITNNWFHGKTTSAERPDAYMIEGAFSETVFSENNFAYSEQGFIKFSSISARNHIINNNFANAKTYMLYFDGTNYNSRLVVNGNIFEYTGVGETDVDSEADGIIYATNRWRVEGTNNFAATNSTVVPLFTATISQDVITKGYILTNSVGTYKSEGYGSATVANGETVTICPVASPRIMLTSRTAQVGVTVASQPTTGTFTVGCWNLADGSAHAADDVYIYYTWQIP